jgi:hypothetical protein
VLLSHAPVGSGYTQCNNIARSDAIPKWAIFEPFLANFRESTLHAVP